MRPLRSGISSSKSSSVTESRITSSSSLSCQISHSLCQRASVSGERGSRSIGALPAFLVLAEFEDDVGYLRGEELLDREAHGVAGAREARDELRAYGTGESPAQDGRGPDLLVGEHAEDLAEPVELLLEHPIHDLVGRVPSRDTCAAGGYDGVHVRPGDQLHELRPDS